MTGQDIFAALGELDERLVDEAAAAPPAARRRWRWQSAGLIAACLCLALLGYGYLRGPDFIGRSGSSGTSAEQIVTEDAVETEAAAEAESAEEFKGAEAPVVTGRPAEDSADASSRSSTVSEDSGADTAETGESAAKGREQITAYSTEGLSGLYAQPEQGECILTASVKAALEAYSGQDVEFVLSIDVYTDVLLDDFEAKEVLAELRQQGYRLYTAESWGYDSDPNGEVFCWEALVGCFTAEELEQFEADAADSEYGYFLSFISTGDGSPWSGTLTPLED